MKKRGPGGPIYFASLLILNLILGGAIAAARNAEDNLPAFDPLSFQRLVDRINKNDSFAALSKPGECTFGEGVICSHDVPEKLQISRLEERAEQEIQKLRSGR